MKIDFPSFTLYADVLRESKSPRCLFMLHGFTGCTADWKEIADGVAVDINIIAIDLIGHGKSSSPGNPDFYTAAEVSSQLNKIISSFTSKRKMVLGYSMGGRAAISLAINFPHLLEGIILESCTAGLKSEYEREERMKKDIELINFISSHSIEEFIDYWMNLDIFNTQRRFSDAKLRQIKDSKLPNNKSGLINSIKGFSVSVMPSYWNDLKEINVKTLLISGELDSKYTAINREMHNLIPSSEHVIINSAGHNSHLEKPEQFLSAVNNFLSSF